MSHSLILLGALLEAAGFCLATLVIREMRGGRLRIEEKAIAAWKRLPFVRSGNTQEVRHATDLIAVRESVTVVKSPNWDAMTADERLGWLRDQILEAQKRLNGLAVDVENERVLRDSAVQDLSNELRRDIHEEIHVSQSKHLSKESLSIFLFVLGLALGTIGNLI